MRTGRLVVLAALGTSFPSGCARYVEIGANEDDIAGNVVPPEAGTSDTSTDAAVRDAVGNDIGAIDGASPTILWSTGAESGDFSDWNRDGSPVGGMFQHLVEVSVSEERAHSGTHSMKIGFDSTDGQDHMAEFYRRVEAGPAYYGAWYFIEEAHAPKTWWTLFYFFYQTEAGNTGTRHGLWDVNLNAETLYFYDERTLRPVSAMPRKAYPVGQWFHIEAYFAYEPPRNAHVKVWLDGDVLLDVKDLGTAPSDNLYWGIGSDTGGLVPAVCTMYIDDVTISTGRLGP